MGSKVSGELSWKELCGTCRHSLLVLRGKETAICKEGRFGEADLSRMLCPHKEERQEEGHRSHHNNEQDLVRLSQ